jgi:phosphate ABC transporter phosphate-binding protein
MTTPEKTRSGFSRARIFLIILIVALAGGKAVRAQTAETLSQVRKVYVDSMGDGKGAAEMRARISNRLRASRKFQLAANAGEADAIIKGTGRIWAAGYMSVSVHPTRADRHAVFDGFLSAEVTGKAGATLWSFLVTPSRFSIKRITTDLADQVVQRLLEAAEHQSQEMQVPAANSNSAAVSVHGAGGTFPWPIYQEWIESFQRVAPNTHIAYDPVGSETAIRQLTEGAVDFAGSDMPLSDQAMAQSKTRFLHVPSVLGGVVPIYNLNRADRLLNFTPEALAGIYLGTIKKWNDPLLRVSNPGVSLPDSDIVVIHRSDGSGTTFVWSDYLSKVSAQWRERVGAPGTTISWPIGQGADRSEGVAALVHQTPNSIGYVELIYAIQHELRFGAVRNAAGNFVKANLSSLTAAATGVEAPNSDFRVSITNAPGKYAYPIATFTWLLLPADGDPSPKRSATIDFLRWALTSGQRQCSGLGYAPLPTAVANQALQVLNSVK